MKGRRGERRKCLPSAKVIISRYVCCGRDGVRCGAVKWGARLGPHSWHGFLFGLWCVLSVRRSVSRFVCATTVRSCNRTFMLLCHGLEVESPSHPSPLLLCFVLWFSDSRGVVSFSALHPTPVAVALANDS